MFDPQDTIWKEEKSKESQEQERDQTVDSCRFLLVIKSHISTKRKRKHTHLLTPAIWSFLIQNPNLTNTLIQES